MEPGLASFVSGFLNDSESKREYRPLPLAGGGSKRRFWRIHTPSGCTYVAMWNAPVNPDSVRENRAYLLIGKHLLEKTVPLPRIYRADPYAGFFIMEDLGDRNLQEISREGDPAPLYREALRVLLHMQTAGSEGFEPQWTCQTERYDRGVMRRSEAEYFRDAFLHRYLGLKPGWPELDISFERIAEAASRAPGPFFLHRDFQSRNIMVTNGRIGVIDWQGGRLGPLGYDAASLLIDPYTELTPQHRAEHYRFYLNLVRDRAPSWADALEESYPYLALQRNMQILGAFAHLSKVAGKPCFEAYIPKALESLRALLAGVGGPELRPLMEVAGEAAGLVGQEKS